MQQPQTTAVFSASLFRLAGLLVALVLLLPCPRAFAAETIPISRYQKPIDPNISYNNDRIEFYGLQIHEKNDDLVAYYNKKKVVYVGVGHIFSKTLNIKSAYVVENYPGQGMATLFVPLFTGGANCCFIDLLVTKTDKGLSITTVDAGSGHGISADDIKSNKDPSVSNDCMQRIDFDKVDPEMFGWCTASAPRPEACLVFENDAWRFAKPAERSDRFEHLLRNEMTDLIAQSSKHNLNDPYDKEMLYAGAANIVYYSIMAGKSDMETSNLLKKAVPGLDEQHRINFIGNIKAAIDTCRALESQKIPAGQAGTTSNPTTSSSSATPGSAARGSLQITPCGSITDAKNRLEWFVGPDETVTFAQAKAWVKAFNTCGSGWELPTIAQLASLFEARSTAGTGYVLAGKHWPAHMNPLFSGIGSGSWVWSREEINANVAKSYNFNQGSETRTDKDNKTMTIRVFAVRKI